MLFIRQPQFAGNTTLLVLYMPVGHRFKKKSRPVAIFCNRISAKKIIVFLSNLLLACVAPRTGTL